MTVPVTMRSFYAIAIWLVFVWTSSSASIAEGEDNDNTNTDSNQQLPNIIMIVLDDLGSHDLGLHGTGIHTPNIDGFVTGATSDGIYLDDYYVLPYCSPTRAALLSGMYPLRTGLHQVIVPVSTAGLPLNIETLPEMLKKATVTTRRAATLSGPSASLTEEGSESEDGQTTASNHRIVDYSSKVKQQEQQLTYQTHAVGKWHVGHSSWEQTPTFRGFDTFFGFYQGGQDYFTHKSHGGVDLHHDRSPRCGPGCSAVVDERGNYSTHVFTREAIKVVENHANRFGSGGSSTPTAPLFLYLAYQAVHCPNEVPPEYSARYQNNTDWTKQRISYAGMLTAADEGIGNLTFALKEAGLWENTLVVVTTDNGGPTTVGCAQGSSNYPKRGGKCSLWEGGTTGDALLAGPALESLLSRSASRSSFTASNTKTTKIRERGGDSRQAGGVSFSTETSPRRFQNLFHVVDWFPTLAEWVGVVPSNETVLDGVSQAEALASGQPARHELFGGYAFWKNDNPNQSRWWGPSIRHLNWKLVQGSSGGPDAENHMPAGTKTIIPPGDSSTNNATTNSGSYLLFDLDRDPGETTDLSEAYPEILQKMVYRLKLYRNSFVYPQVNDDSRCPFPGLVNTTNVGPAWLPWCNDLQKPMFALQ